MQVILWNVWAEWIDPDKSPNILIFFFSSILKLYFSWEGTSEDSFGVLGVFYQLQIYFNDMYRN